MTTFVGSSPRSWRATSAVRCGLIGKCVAWSLWPIHNVALAFLSRHGGLVDMRRGSVADHRGQLHIHRFEHGGQLAFERSNLDFKGVDLKPHRIDLKVHRQNETLGLGR